MYVDSSPATARRTANSPRRRSTGCQATAQTATATAHRRRPIDAAARRSRAADAVVAQWLLDQLPADHRHLPRVRRSVTPGSAAGAMAGPAA
jgi:hypothetical protein